MTRSFKAWFGGLLMTTLFVLISVLWIDKPIAILVRDTFGPRHISNSLVHSPGLSIPFGSAIVFAIFGLSAVMGRNFSKLEISILFSDISVLAADAIKNLLKYVFGRTWPDSWDPQILSLVHDNVYGFNFFHDGRSFESFPSGHAAVAASVMSVLWILFPRLRFLWAAFVAAAGFGLVLLNLHFVSDVVAGTFLGVSTGLFTVTLCASLHSQNQGAPPNIRPS